MSILMLMNNSGERFTWKSGDVVITPPPPDNDNTGFSVGDHVRWREGSGFSSYTAQGIVERVTEASLSVRRDGQASHQKNKVFRRSKYGRQFQCELVPRDVLEMNAWAKLSPELRILDVRYRGLNHDVRQGFRLTMERQDLTSDTLASLRAEIAALEMWLNNKPKEKP